MSDVMRKAAAISIVMLAVLAAVCVIPLSDAAYTTNDVTVYPFSENEKILAGGTSDIQIAITNNGTGTVSYKVTASYGNPISCTVDAPEGTLAAGKNTIVTVNVSSDKYADQGKYGVSVSVLIYSYATDTDGSVTIPMTVTVDSEYVSDNQFNKILGMFDNPLEYPLNTPLSTAIITFVIWVAISLAIVCLFALILSKVVHTNKEEFNSLMKKTGVMLFIAVVIHGITEALLVYGASAAIVATMSKITSILYIVLVAYTVWNVYDNAIKHILHKKQADGKLTDVDSTLIPLFNVIGKIVISVCGLAAILSTLGFSLVAILTGAGIITVAISLGAQNTLTEMFAGISLLTARPFKKGDMVVIGSSKDIYEVIRVRLMMTEFKNWINLEHITMPNSTVSKSNVTNITGKTHAYRIFLYYDVAYESDLELVRKILIDTANSHPQVITDGSYSKPDVRLTNFASSSVQYRLAVYIKDFRDNVIVSDELNEAVYTNLCNNDIEIPYDKFDIYVRGAEDEQ